MHFFEVLVAGATFHGNEALTYSSNQPLTRGTIVNVPLRNKQVLGVIFKEVEKPNFAVKTILEVPSDLLPLPAPLITLMVWMKAYYPSSYGIITQQFLPKMLPKKPVIVTLSPDHVESRLPELTNDQKKVLAGVEPTGTHILHGETGTGKTRVYIELARKSLAAGRSAIILTPEIGLTSQLAEDFRNVFGQRIIVIHSQLTEVTRQRLWVSILRQSEPLIIIGPRSALFSPLKNVGLIVIDESHETAYKQDQAPYYHASRVASKLAEIHKAPLILGSATPLVTDYFIALHRKRPILRMTQTARGSGKNKSVEVVDLLDRGKFTKKPYLSDVLISNIKETLERKEQSLLFLNRRGTARVVFCEKCGWQAACPHCDLPLVYHGDSHTVRCHTCDFKTQTPADCPNCHNASIVFKTIGTKAIVDEIGKLFPEATLMRFDTDNKKHERIEQNYASVRNGDIDILIGTQTLAKGLDLPNLGLVGVVIADTSLYFPDFSAQERTYQLLCQVLGRIGRGHRDSKAILQTYSPESPLLKSILEKDWQSFYQKEIYERETFLFPPFCHLLKLSCRRASFSSAQKAAETFASSLYKSSLRIAVEGPAPAFHEKIQNKYQWQIVIKARDRAELIKVIALLPSGWSYDIDPMNLL